jgi:ribonucleotide monophosphatase NagD (HAD superfamily)
VTDVSTTPNRTFVFDLDGVVYLGGEGIPGAGETLRTLDARGDQILFATNNSSRALSTVVGHIARRTGYEPDPGSVITSGMAAARLLGDHETCLVLGSTELEATLAAEGITITDETLALDVIREVGHGGNYLTHEHTARLFRQELYFPSLFPRQTVEQWVESGDRMSHEVAHDRVLEILAEAGPVTLPPGADEALEQALHRATAQTEA